MSVYTPLNLQQVQAFAEPYGLVVTELIPIQGGIENTNYFLVCEDAQQFVLTVFEELSEQAAGELVPVLTHLGQNGVPVAVPLQPAGQAIHRIAGKPAQIAPRLQGEHPSPATLPQVEAIAVAQARMHVVLQDYPLQRESNHGQSWWVETATRLRQRMNAEDQALLDQVFECFKTCQSEFPDRPQGLIHADLFRDNTLFVGPALHGILDFSELNRDDLLLDIAITLNDFCSDYPEVTLDEEKADAYLNAYQLERELTPDEFACLPVYLAMAACRFWLSRLEVAERNAIEGRSSADILQKDPLEMRNMLVERLKYVG